MRCDSFPALNKSSSPTMSTNASTSKPQNSQRQLRKKDRSMKSITQLLKGSPRTPKILNPPIKRVKSQKDSERFKLDDITNVPITKSISAKHIDIVIDPTIQLANTRVARPRAKEQAVKRDKSKQIQGKSEPIIETKSIAVQPIQPEVTIQCVRKTKQKQKKLLKTQQNIQFHPSIGKRMIKYKSDWLKPKHEYKTVCQVNGVVRRKLYVPKQGINPPRQKLRVPQIVSQDLEVKELVKLADDEGLNEEDLMEILTCPSPVWWENASDGEYFEDGIPLQIAVDTRFIDYETNRDAEQDKQAKIPLADVKINKSDKKFMQKRFKLEKLLGNMKNSVHIPSNDTLGCDNEESNLNDDTTDNHEFKSDKFSKNHEHNNVNEDDHILDTQDTANVNNYNFNEISNDDKINQVEFNTKIISEIFKEVPNKIENESITEINEPMGKLEDINSLSSEDTFNEALCDKPDLESLHKVNLEEIVPIDDDITTEPTLSSPYSFKSLSSDPVTEDNIDSISDTNVKFITEEKNTEDTESDEMKNNEEIKPNDVNKNDSIKLKIKDTYKELMMSMTF